MGLETVVGRLGPLAAALGIGVAVALAGSASALADPGDPSTPSTDRPSPVRPDRSSHRVHKNPAPREPVQSRNRTKEQKARSATVLAAVPPAAAQELPDTGRKEPVAAMMPPAITAQPAVAAIQRTSPRGIAAPHPGAAAHPAEAGIITTLVSTESADGGGPAAPPTGPSAADVTAVAYVRRETTRARGSFSFAPLFRNATPTLNPSQSGQGAGGIVTGRLNAVDPDSVMLTYTVTRAPAHGTVAVLADGSYVYTTDPALAATGTTDSFVATVSDAGSGFHLHGLASLINRAGHTGSATVSVVVAPFGAPKNVPTATALVDSPNRATGTVTGRVLGADADGDPLTYSSQPTTEKGNVGLNATSGAFTYVPTETARRNAAATGATDADRSDTFTVAVTDGRGGATSVVVTVPVVPASTPESSLPAFPGAEGFGAYATGGRGGSVIYVTNLNAGGPGSLQWAVDQPGAKYILFKVSGVIDAQIHLTNGDVTIAGQTSPGGITVRGFVTDETPYQDQDVRSPADFAENWILQHIRIRPGLDGVSDDGLRMRYTRNAIVDHVSIGNATDEAIEISYSHDITVQNTLIAETVGGHSFYGGVLMNYSNPANGFGLDNVSLHHNVFNRIEGRLPEGSRESLAAAGSYMNFEMSNNLYWDPNFFVALAPSTGVVSNTGGEPYPVYWNLNAVNNFFRTRADFPYGMFDDQIMRTTRNNLYVSGNTMSLYPARSDYQLFYCCNDYPSVSDPDTASQLARKLPSRNPFPLITYTPTDQLANVLLNTAGAWPRDPMDIRLMGSVAANTIAAAPRNTNPAGDALLPAYAGSAPPAPADTDNDGMPDSWERAKGLNPNIANTNGNTLSGLGYTDLEVYLHELSAGRVAGASLTS